MAAGTPAFRGETAAVIFDAILNQRPVALTRLNPDVPPRLDDIVQKALEKNRDLRYTHAAEIETDLQRLKRELEGGSTASVTTVSGAEKEMTPLEPVVANPTADRLESP